MFWCILLSRLYLHVFLVFCSAFELFWSLKPAGRVLLQVSPFVTVADARAVSVDTWFAALGTPLVSAEVRGSQRRPRKGLAKG